ncbi:MAG TPA: hypothetical protein VLJ68_08045 [Chitinophagaceae bacterium]|nr:hypothetical protein [Chitinophagaceae bacterium]
MNKSKAPSRVAIFGFKDPDYPIFLVIGKNMISHKWFDIDFSKSIGVLFVGEGAQFVKHKEWKKLFKGYVFFNENFDFLDGLPGFEAERRIIFSQFTDVLTKRKDILKIKDEFSKIFNKALERISNYPTLDTETFELCYKIRINEFNLNCFEN